MRRWTAALGVMAIFASAVNVYAQGRIPSGSGLGGSTSRSSYGASSAGGSSGMFGARNLGSSLSGGNRGFAGGGGAGRGGVAGATMQDGNVGEIQGNERFVRGARQPGQFVGADGTDLPSFLTQIATGGQINSGLNSRGGNRGQNQVNNFNQGNGGGRNAARNGQRATYRTTRIVGFDYPAPPEPTVKAVLQERLTKLPQLQSRGPIEVELQDRTAILRGVVATAHDRDLIERLALLEAGISRVQNELTVATPPSADQSQQ